ncbi:MAG: DUF1778 domain-containing protein [Candidatus Azotimanducaceae bacterium WSBS_2022_MAG_OTU7]
MAERRKEEEEEEEEGGNQKIVEKETRVAMSLKIRPSQKSFLDYASAISSKNRSEFILESAIQSAEDVVMNQSVFQFRCQTQFAAFKQALNEPVNKTTLNALFSKQAP